jgi:hypothetical protein
MTEIAHENLRAELHEALQSANAAPAARRKPQRKTKQHGSKSRTKLLYARIREIPQEVSLKTFCQRCDRMQRPFPVPKYLIDQGYPEKWLEAWKVPMQRRKLHDLRQRAWKSAKSL